MRSGRGKAADETRGGEVVWVMLPVKSCARPKFSVTTGNRVKSSAEVRLLLDGAMKLSAGLLQPSEQPGIGALLSDFAAL